MKKYLLILTVLVSSCLSVVFANELVSTSPANAKVYIISPKDGQTVAQTFKIEFGLSNMGIAPAGINIKNTGHHHLLIDTDVKSLDFAKTIPSTKKVIHYGGGQTEAEITLAPGKHTLQLLLGNYVHLPHDKPVFSKKITVIVKE
ncbi:MAG: DUF4399 domain-containing protein [Ostreibacterium sp.]